MEVVWELKTATGTQKRRAAKACNDCKRRKKKCPHTRSLSQRRHSRSAPGGRGGAQSPGTTCIDYTLKEPPQDVTKSSDDPSETSGEPIQVGDYHAESLLTELAAETPGEMVDRPGTQDYREPYDSSVTQLVGRRNTLSRCCIETIQRHENRWEYDLTCEPKTWVAEHYCDHAGALKALALPRDTQDALITTYISSLDALIPIVDGGQILRDYTMGRASPYLVNAICLTSCKTKQAAPYLRLSDDGPTLAPNDFAKAIYRDLEVAMKLDLEPNRLIKVQILALMWLHHDEYRGMQKSSAYLSQAIHDAFVLSLHFENPNRPARVQCSYLWWTLRALDRQNACLQGVPLVIADRDVDLSRPLLKGDNRSQVATITLRLGDEMDEVMEIYRPFLQRRGQTVLDEFPTFSEIAAGVDLSRLQESHKGKYSKPT
ncbi:uncharacterized protein N7487_003017 [Penicillium crustosum]|uniref:uncharacterized protein n=1 Tax=Penicillium crustosum TaxID=36656 RepID=UPI00238881F0|nr:uncharacterized protein N7487_003017 [Penicillium crustosum]KAJ5419467.1 hypothetical protein N7487_003017 [Penicillium crustosum]